MIGRGVNAGRVALSASLERGTAAGAGRASSTAADDEAFAPAAVAVAVAVLAVVAVVAEASMVEAAAAAAARALRRFRRFFFDFRVSELAVVVAAVSAVVAVVVGVAEERAGMSGPAAAAVAVAVAGVAAAGVVVAAVAGAVVAAVAAAVAVPVAAAICEVGNAVAAALLAPGVASTGEATEAFAADGYRNTIAPTASVEVDGVDAPADCVGGCDAAVDAAAEPLPASATTAAVGVPALVTGTAEEVDGTTAALGVMEELPSESCDGAAATAREDGRPERLAPAGTTVTADAGISNGAPVAPTAGCAATQQMAAATRTRTMGIVGTVPPASLGGLGGRATSAGDVALHGRERLASLPACLLRTNKQTIRQVL